MGRPFGSAGGRTPKRGKASAHPPKSATGYYYSLLSSINQTNKFSTGANLYKLQTFLPEIAQNQSPKNRFGRLETKADETFENSPYLRFVQLRI